VSERFDLAPASLDYLLDKSKLLAWLEADCILPSAKRCLCAEELAKLPDQIRVATMITRVTFDLVIQDDGHTYYWEFHEEQHRSLAVDRRSLAYGPDGRDHFVPRFLQRLIRDIWRIKAFPNVTVVWYDWFEKRHLPNELFMSHGFREYCLPERFSFTTFLTDH
jgi:hypothetical protein